MSQTIFRRLRVDWPLLGKELIEQSARRQMYVLRVIYAVVLFSAFCFYYEKNIAEGPLLALGRGLAPFQFLVATQMVAIYLFLPPLMAGAVAREKERETLGLLFLTDLTSWQFILQKFIGRLIPMLTLLLLSLPLMAVAYSLGGVSVEMLIFSAIKLFVTCLWVGALALECSVYAATTFEALIRAWGFILGLSAFCWLSPFSFSSVFASQLISRGSGGFLIVPSLVIMVIYLFITYALLSHARHILGQRAFAKPRNPFGQQFKQLDQYWKNLRKLIRAMLRKRDSEALAIANEIIQRDAGGTGKTSSVGSYVMARMQIPNILSFAIILGFIALLILVTAVVMDPKSGGAFYLVIGALWILGVFSVPIQSANAVASERISERLGPILTTPLTAREIIEEWLAPVDRWIQFLSRPLIVMIATEAIVKYLRQDPATPRLRNVLCYLILSLATVWIYPRFVKWSCFYLALRIHNQIRALMTCFFTVAAWCVLPPVLAGFMGQTQLQLLVPPEIISVLSPATVIRAIESIGMPDRGMALVPGELFAVFAHPLLVGIALWIMQRLCLTQGDRHLGRL